MISDDGEGVLRARDAIDFKAGAPNAHHLQNRRAEPATRETARLFGLLDTGLAGRDDLAGDYSIAGMCCWNWIDAYPQNVGGLEGFPQVVAWHARIAVRPPVQRALRVGSDMVDRIERRRDNGDDKENTA